MLGWGAFTLACSVFLMPVVNPDIYSKGPFVRPGKRLEYLKLFYLGLASSLANPYGWKVYSVIANHQKYIDMLQDKIQEWTTLIGEFFENFVRKEWEKPRGELAITVLTVSCRYNGGDYGGY